MEKYQKIMEKKMSIPVEVQCKNLPIEFSIYLNYCRALRFEDKPNYSYLRNLFLDLIDREGINYNYDFDWCHLNEEKTLENSKIKIEIRQPVRHEAPLIDLKKGDSNIEVNVVESRAERKVVDQSKVNVKIDESKQGDMECDEIIEDLEEGEENIVDDELVDTSEKDFMRSSGDKFMSDLEEKKNKLLYD